MRVLGIDEAGRGCVLGDLVVAGFLWTGGDVKPLVDAGATDSKAISARKRDAARLKLAKLGPWAVRRVTPAQIDAGNLNTLEEHAIVSLIREFAPDHVIIDALGPPSGLARVIARLSAQVAPLAPRFTIEPKADLNHPVCGAASILAKTTRDAELTAIREAWGDLGSGYPSDPKTRGWLQAQADAGSDWPSFVRTRWGTVQALAQGRLI